MKNLLVILAIAFCIAGCKKEMKTPCGNDIDAFSFTHSFEKGPSFFLFRNQSDRIAIATIKVYWGSGFVSTQPDSCNAMSNDTILFTRFHPSFPFDSIPYDSAVASYKVYGRYCSGTNWVTGYSFVAKHDVLIY